MQNHNLDKNLQNFLNHLDSVKDTLPMIMLLLNPYHKKANKEYFDFLDNNVEELETEDGKKVVAFKYEEKPRYEKLRKNAHISGLAQKIIPESLFVSLISQYDNFLNQLLRLIFIIKPEILNSSQKQLTFSEIVDLGSLDNARDYIVEKEIDSVLRESHTVHFEYLENKLGLSLRKNLPIWKNFIEITERRNLFVHCDGIVSRQYLSVCKKNDVPNLKEYKIGDRLKVTLDYFKSAYECLYEISTKLTHTIWRKLIIEDLENADDHLNNICFDLISNGDYDLASILLEFACDQKKHFNDTTYNIFLVNKSLSKLLNKNHEEARKLISSKDWSASSDNFKIAYHAIMGEDEKVFKLMRKIGSNGDVTKEHYKIWPLFNELKGKEEFKACFKEVFAEDFTITDKPLSSLQQVIETELKKETKSKTPIKREVRKRPTRSKKLES